VLHLAVPAGWLTKFSRNLGGTAGCRSTEGGAAGAARGLLVRAVRSPSSRRLEPADPARMTQAMASANEVQRGES